jgi:3-hydroxyisobutyrate dehydrogenase-like beta-hydroxyacid dehydrogenase
MDAQHIGFIGLGVMGAPMATHLAKAGHHLWLHDAQTDLALNLATAIGPQAVALEDPRAVGAHSDIVFTMLPHGQVVQSVALGLDQPGFGLINGLKAGGLLVDTSSCEPWLTRQTAQALAERGIGMIDAPVSGAQWGAQAAELVFMVGGASADLARVRPLLDVMGKSVFHLGEVGCGHAMKAINNCITAITLMNTTEGLLAGQRYGLDPAVMVDVLNASTGGSWVAQTHFHQRVFNRAFDDPFKLALMVKDMGIAMQLAEQTQTPAPVWAVAQALWQQAQSSASDQASVSELVRWMETQTGTPLHAGQPGDSGR